MKHFLLASLSILMLAGTAASAQNGLVTVSGTHFIRDGKPYYYAGANYWYGAVLGSEKYGDRARLRRELDQMKAAGIDNLRVMAGADGGTYDYTVSYALQPQQGKYDDELFDGLDFLLSEMGKRHMVAVLYLTNCWEWSGGMSQYLEWNGYGKIPNPNVDPKNTWDEFMAFVPKFYSCGACKTAFETHIRNVIGRTNRYTRKKYTDDPAIMAWEVCNEPRIFSAGNEKDFTAWLNASVDLIDSLDKNHLICTGSEGEIGSNQDLSAYERTHQNPNIDYLTIHIWPKNWEWYDAQNEAGTLPQAVEKTSAYIDRHLALATKMGRPLVIEEFGLPRREESRQPSANIDGRNAYYRFILNRVERSHVDGGPVSGANFWGYAGEGRGQNKGKWNKGDAFTADPPQEPQGLNSVFDTDTSTLRIVREANRKLSESKKPRR